MFPEYFYVSWLESFISSCLIKHMKEKRANGMKEWTMRAANIITLNQPVYFIFILRTTKGEKKGEEVWQWWGLFHGMLWRAEPSSSIMKDLFKPHSPPPFDHQCFKSRDSLICKYRVWGSSFWSSYAWEIRFQEWFRDGRPEAHDQEGHVIWCSLRSWALFSCEDPTLIQS